MSSVTYTDISDAISALESQHNIKVQFNFDNAPCGTDSLVYAFLAVQINNSIKERNVKQIKENVNSIFTKLKDRASQVSDILTKE